MYYQAQPTFLSRFNIKPTSVKVRDKPYLTTGYSAAEHHTEQQCRLSKSGPSFNPKVSPDPKKTLDLNLNHFQIQMIGTVIIIMTDGMTTPKKPRLASDYKR